jgi:PAS domain S-box-containing protein
LKYEFAANVLPLIASSFITLFLGTYAFIRRRNAKGVLGFILSMLVLTIWSVTNALEMCGADLSTKLFWANMQYFAYCYSPVTLFVLCSEFSGYDRLYEKKKLLWLAVIPTVILLLVWTNTYHGLVRYDVYLDFSGALPVIAKKYGPAFYVHALYSYALNFSAYVMLIRVVFFKQTVFRKQALSLLFSLSFIFIPNMVYVLGTIPSYRFDITPVFFGPAGLIAALGIFRYKLFDAVPIAWAAVVRNMDSGVMVLDMFNRILDINPAFEKIIGRKANEINAKQAGEVCGDIPALSDACADTSVTRIEFSINTKEITRIYEASFSFIFGKNGEAVGRIVIANDITEKIRQQQDLLEQQWKLAVADEQERLARDLHDNLGQIMGFINMQAQGIRQELKNEVINTVSDKLDKLVNVTQSAHSDLREYIRSIRNHASPGLDLLTALYMNIHHFKEQTGLNVELDKTEAAKYEDIKPDVRINILNIVKEALNNIAKHSKAKKVKIVLRISEKEIFVLIEDDGKGFDIKASQSINETNFGLGIMRERAEKIGGGLWIDSRPGAGTRITLRIPPVNRVKEETPLKKRKDSGKELIEIK